MASRVTDIDRQTLNIETVGRMLGISRPTAYELARRDKLPVPVIRLGDNRMVVSKRALDRVLDADKHDDTAA